MDTYLGFILLFIAAEILISAIQFLLRKKKIKALLRTILIVVKALLAVGCAVIVLAGPVIFRPVQPFLFALYVALFADAAADALISIIAAVSKKKRSFAAAKAVSIVFGVAFLAFGIVNMETVTPNYHTYTSEKITEESTFVFVADLHVGSAQSFETTKKTIEKINAEKPDFIVLGGDITDDYTTKEEMENVFALFGGSSAPVYYVYGNHDRQGHAEYANGRQYTEEELEKTLRDNDIIILSDEFAELSVDFYLLGREDASEKDRRKDISELSNPAPEAFLLTVDHQPGEFRDNLSIGTDLQLSGHTHAGQLFPLRALYALIGGYVYGDYEIDGKTMNVSAGACGWRVPLRTDARCQFEVVTIKPQGEAG